MTTINLRVKPDMKVKNITEHVEGVVKVLIMGGGPTPVSPIKPKTRADTDEDVVKVAVDFMPVSREPQRKGARGIGRGTSRGVS